MKQGFVKVAAATPKVVVADVDHNVERIKELMDESVKRGVKITVFPELCITGYTCGELFLQKTLLDRAFLGLKELAEYTENLDGIFFVGLPVVCNHKLYNAAAAISRGEILGMVPKTNLPNYSEFYEARYFTSGEGVDFLIEDEISLSRELMFVAEGYENIRIAVEICEDLWVPNPPSIQHCLAGATIIANLSASDAITGKSAYRSELVKGQSARLNCGYIYASAGEGESTMDVVYSGENLIAENGNLLSKSEPFSTGLTVTELDVERMDTDRRRMNTYGSSDCEEYETVYFELEEDETRLTRYIDNAPFVPSDVSDRRSRCEEIFNIQAEGLKKRLQHTKAQSVVIGISGGLDSTLALLVAARAYDKLSMDRKDIIAVTMPGFGTTDRTYDNACRMVKHLGATLKEVSIKEAVMQHFKDIEHDENVHDVTYENCQARERTQILMDMANKYGGMVIGTGDMSELALGWATYNGDHMSMYGVNVSVPKTLVRHLVQYYADTCENRELQKVLLDVLDTPVSPELLPPKDGKIAQKTEDIVGPYELHDFVLYYLLRYGFCPSKIYRLAVVAFRGVYHRETILKWMKTFYRRFFAQQFKRSCLPDGPKVGSVAVSPRGDLRMPSDASSALWLKELEDL
ncbi:MAG: NAD(+) synthase [Lachnospiraceae bacterium]|nr:NAD(+) synthase [Lachnospiraceae bacterium]